MAKNTGALTSSEDIKQLGTILAVWAHPDDESFLAAGLLSAAAANGQKVICITATKGQAGKTADASRWPTSKLGSIRTKELTDALRILGIKKHHWLTYRDGHCAEVPISEGASHVAKFIQLYKPDTIITFGPHGTTGHTDHIAMSKWVQRAVDKLAKPPVVYHAADTTEQFENYMKQIDEKVDLYFNIDQPKLVPGKECDIYFRLPKSLCQRKCQALGAQPSQTETIFKMFDSNFMLNAMSVEAFTRAK